ncbi:hypothetical protein [Streptomyces vilmorinianum]|uniref:hypothetical protein n=1 Tax=Streptomyces vilmorinianum TaxID=3051092 RepID=UPI0010FB1DC7|nr:hypothetical protein [Streptomyces vilmorinianum]
MAQEAQEIRTFTIGRRFNGPPDSANGGYACGLFAALGAGTHGDDAAVTLLAPPPLDTPLTFHPGGRRSQIRDGDTLIATVTAGGGAIEVLPPVSLAEATAASGRFHGEDGHPFPTCFVCGVDRGPSDGLRMRPGLLADRTDAGTDAGTDTHTAAGTTATVACAWTPDDTVTDPDGRVRGPVLWAALDCPGGWTSDPALEPMVLSRMTARVTEPPEAGHTYVVLGRRLRRSGRTAVNATALYTTDGRLVAHASAVWAAVNDTATPGVRPVHV